VNLQGLEPSTETFLVIERMFDLFSLDQGLQRLGSGSTHLLNTLEMGCVSGESES
jgi:hypothetical protein